MMMNTLGLEGLQSKSIYIYVSDLSVILYFAPA